MPIVLDYINEYEAENGRPTMTKDELLKRYGTKFMMWIYMEYTLVAETIPAFQKKMREENPGWEKSKDIRMKIGEAIVKEFGELGLVKFVIMHMGGSRYHTDMVVYFYGDVLFQEMIQFLIE